MLTPTDTYVPLPTGGYGWRLGPLAVPNRKHDSSRSDFGGLLIGDAFSMGRPGRMALPVARRHGDPPAPPCGSGDNHPDRYKRPDDSAGAESPSRVQGRSRRSGDHGVPLPGGSLGDLDVFHKDRSTWLAAPRRTCRSFANSHQASPTGIAPHSWLPTGARLDLDLPSSGHPDPLWRRLDFRLW